VSPSFRLLLLSALLLTGCGSALGQAVDELEAGRHPEAARRFRALESALAELEPGEQLRYGLYRGLNDLALGDARSAARWLAPVKRAVDEEPRVLTHAERGRLFAAWRSMGRMPGE
jgi:hypothetical protein